jgi:hypothetical protein
MFRVGQKVVCVDDTWKSPFWNEVTYKPTEGVIYEVRRVIPGWWPCGATGILLVELVNPERKWVGDPIKSECPFWIERFRPIVERKTSIEIFTRMLKSENVNA